MYIETENKLAYLWARILSFHHYLYSLLFPKSLIVLSPLNNSALKAGIGNLTIESCFMKTKGWAVLLIG
jgi:hypothetical protein